MMGSIFLTAFGLLFLVEGILPFLSPVKWRYVMQQMFIQSDQMIRFFGLISMLLGLLLVSLAHHFFK